MTVQQYDIRFTKLSCFALKLVATDAQRIQKFVRVLYPLIQNDVTSVDLLTFEENLKKAFWLEDCTAQIEVVGPRGFGLNRPNPALQSMQQQQPKRQNN